MDRSRTIKEVRAFLEHNKAISGEAHSILDEARKKAVALIEEHFIVFTPEEEILVRQIGICDYYRMKYPDSKSLKTDEQIIKHMKSLKINSMKKMTDRTQGNQPTIQLQN